MSLGFGDCGAAGFGAGGGRICNAAPVGGRVCVVVGDEVPACGFCHFIGPVGMGGCGRPIRGGCAGLVAGIIVVGRLMIAGAFADDGVWFRAACMGWGV